jgi:hypothetical protein
MEPIINRVIHDSVESNLCYPSRIDFRLDCVVDKEHVVELLQAHFGPTVNRINNKYVIDMDGKYFYQHDNKTYLLELVDAENSNDEQGR